MTIEPCLTTFWNGDDIIEVGFTEWASDGADRWAPVGITEFVIPADGDRVVVELPTGCVEWTHGPLLEGGTFTIQAGSSGSAGQSFVSCQRGKVISEPVRSKTLVQRMLLR